MEKLKRNILFILFILCLTIWIFQIDRHFGNWGIWFVLVEFLKGFYFDLKGYIPVVFFLLIVYSSVYLFVVSFKKLTHKEKIQKKEETEKFSTSNRPRVLDDSTDNRAKVFDESTDLLGHIGIVTILFDQIMANSKNSENLKIGIEGEYGVGKSSTILTLVDRINKTGLNNSKIRVIEISPWFFKEVNDFYSHFFELLKEELKEIGDLERKINLLMESLNILSKRFLGLEFPRSIFSRKKNLKSIKNDIESILKEEEIKVLLIFYDLDRSEQDISDKILSMVNNILDIDNMVVILEYNEKYLKEKIKDFDIEKMLDWKVPLIVDKRVVYDWFFSKLEDIGILKPNATQGIYISEYEYLEKYSPIKKIMESYLTNMRKAKNLINDILWFYKDLEDQLFFPHFLLLTLMKREKIELFYFFYKEFVKQFSDFIHEDIQWSEERNTESIRKEPIRDGLNEFIASSHIPCDMAALYLNALFGSTAFKCEDNKIVDIKNNEDTIRSDLENSTREFLTKKSKFSLKYMFQYFIYFSGKEESSGWFSKRKLQEIINANKRSKKKYLEEELFSLDSYKITKFLHFWYLLLSTFEIVDKSKNSVRDTLQIIWQKERLSENFTHPYSIYFIKEFILKDSNIEQVFLDQVKNPFLLHSVHYDLDLRDFNNEKKERYKKRMKEILKNNKCVCEFGINFGYLKNQKDLLVTIVKKIKDPDFTANYLSKLLKNKKHKEHGEWIIGELKQKKENEGFQEILKKLQALGIENYRRKNERSD